MADVSLFTLPEWYVVALQEEYDFKVALETLGIDAHDRQNIVDFINLFVRSNPASWENAKNYFLLRLQQGAFVHTIFIEMLNA